jgi:hypothetical protein
MPVRAIQKKWAALRAVLFPWEIGGYMALAVLIAVIADGLAWALDIAVAVLAGAKSCAERPAASGWSSSPAAPAPRWNTTRRGTWRRLLAFTVYECFGFAEHA